MSNAIRQHDPAAPLPPRRKQGASDSPHAASSQAPRLQGDQLRLSTKPKHRFLQEMHAAAIRVQHKTGLPAQVILAQAALESDWGRAAIGKYNVFGIKGEGSKGSISVPTREYVDGSAIRTVAKFAHFANFEEAFTAYARLIHNGKHPRAVAAKADPVAFAKALQGTYATDPAYGRKLINVMRSQGLI